MEGGRVSPSYGQGRYGDVPPGAPDIVAMSVLPIRLPHHTIGSRLPRTFPPNAVSVEEQGNDHCGGEPSRCVQSWQRTFWSAHSGETRTPPSVTRGRGRQERQMRALCVAGSSVLSGCISAAPSLGWLSVNSLPDRPQ